MKNPFSWQPTCPMRTDRHTDMPQLRVAFRNFAKAPDHSRCLPQLTADLPAETQTGDLANASKRKPLKRDIQQLNSTAFLAHPACRILSYCIKKSGTRRKMMMMMMMKYQYH